MSNLIRMRAKFVCIQVATTHGVAERWLRQYQEHDGKWRTETSEQIYKSLCALGANPDREHVAEIIGNKSWSYICCDGCSAYVDRVVEIGEYDAKAYCATCITEAFSVLSEPEPMTPERAEELSRRAT